MMLPFKKGSHYCTGFCAISTAVRVLRAALSLCVQTQSTSRMILKQVEVGGQFASTHTVMWSVKHNLQELCREHCGRGSQEGGQPGELGSTADSRKVGEGVGRNTTVLSLWLAPCTFPRAL